MKNQKTDEVLGMVKKKDKSPTVVIHFICFFYCNKFFTFLIYKARLLPQAVIHFFGVFDLT